MPFPHYNQLDAIDCGPTCLRMVAKYYGKSVSLDYLRNKAQFGKEGVSLLGLAEAAESIGFKSVGAKLSFEQLINDVPLPAILHWGQYHFVVLTPYATTSKITIADPARSVLLPSNVSPTQEGGRCANPNNFRSNFMSTTSR